jgi:hypothetical protein
MTEDGGAAVNRSNPKEDRGGDCGDKHRRNADDASSIGSSEAFFVRGAARWEQGNVEAGQRYVRIQ